MAGLGPVVAALWKELGLAPPVEAVGSEFDFDLGSTAFRLQMAENGERVVVRGRIGFLDGNAHEAGDQLQRVMRLGLALTALNGAALDAAEAQDILEPGHVGPVPVYAVAMALLTDPATIIPAVRAVLDWQSATEAILSRGEEAEYAEQAERGNKERAELDTGMIIFQP